MKITSVVAGFVVATFADSSLFGAEDPTAQNRFFVNLDQYVKRFHKSDLTPDYPLVRMSFLEQTDELLKVTSTPLCLPTIQQARTRWCSGVRGPLPMCASTIPSRD